MSNIHKDLAGITTAALHYAEEHKCNYTVIIHNPVDGKFDIERSTYEFVTDSYFEKPRTNVLKLYDTNELQKKEVTDPVFEGVILPTRGAGSLHKMGGTFDLVSRGRVAQGHGEPDMILADGLMHDIKSSGVMEPVKEKYVSSFNGHSPFKRVQKKVQNNEPCPCGSGKKFKNCHKHENK